MTIKLHRKGMDLDGNKELKAEPAQGLLFAADRVRGSYDTHSGTI